MILEKLARVLDTDIYTILQIDKKNNIDVEKIIIEEKLKIKKQLIKKITIAAVAILILFLIILFMVIPFGYEIKHLRYNYGQNKLIDLGIPKYSFLMQNNENNYSYKNFRGKKILTTEIKSYLNTLEHLNCNNTTYYYDEDLDITIINYEVTNSFFYRNIFYSIRNGNYCKKFEIKDYIKSLGGMNVSHALNKEDTNLRISFYTHINNDGSENLFTAELSIYYFDNKTNSKKVLEKSSGTFEIINDELIYYRDSLIERDNSINVPAISNFVIRSQRLILKDNYLSNYEKSIILK